MIVAAAIAAGFAAVLLWHEHLPAVVVVAQPGPAVGVVRVAAARGHPRPPDAVAGRQHRPRQRARSGLVVRFSDYRRTHLAHHATPDLTDPEVDPESFYVTAERWARTGPLGRALLVACSTLAGRLVLGPLVVSVRHRPARRPGLPHAGGAVRVLGHLGAVVVVLVVVRAAGIAPWLYVLGAGWGGLAVALLRSFPEHRAVADRDAVGRRAHERRRSPAVPQQQPPPHPPRPPGLPWFGLPAVHEAIDGDDAARAGAGLYRGYGEVVRRYLLPPARRLVFNGAMEPTR